MRMTSGLYPIVVWGHQALPDGLGWAGRAAGKLSSAPSPPREPPPAGPVWSWSGMDAKPCSWVLVYVWTGGDEHCEGTYLCRSRLRSSLVSWPRSSLCLLSCCTWVLRASRRRASRWTLEPCWAEMEGPSLLDVYALENPVPSADHYHQPD